MVDSFLSYDWKLQLPSDVSTSVFTGCVGVTLVPSAKSGLSDGSKSFTSCGRSLPAVPLTNSCVALYVGAGLGFATNVQVPTNLASAPLIVSSFLSYDLKVQVPSDVSTSVFTGCVGVAFVPSAKSDLSLGSKDFTSCGRSLPAVLLTNSCVAL